MERRPYKPQGGRSKIWKRAEYCKTYGGCPNERRGWQNIQIFRTLQISGSQKQDTDSSRFFLDLSMVSDGKSGLQMSWSKIQMEVEVTLFELNTTPPQWNNLGFLTVHSLSSSSFSLWCVQGVESVIHLYLYILYTFYTFEEYRHK